MKIEHTAIYVKDLENAKVFFEKYFGAYSGEKYHNSKTGFQSYFLSFDGGTRLELMYRPEMEEAAGSCASHIAFGVGSREEVDRLTRRLSEDGYEILSGPRTTGDGYYESCIAAEDGNLIEITVSR